MDMLTSFDIFSIAKRISTWKQRTESLLWSMLVIAEDWILLRSCFLMEQRRVFERIMFVCLRFCVWEKFERISICCRAIQLWIIWHCTMKICRQKIDEDLCDWKNYYWQRWEVRELFERKTKGDKLWLKFRGWTNLLYSTGCSQWFRQWIRGRWGNVRKWFYRWRIEIRDFIFDRTFTGEHNSNSNDSVDDVLEDKVNQRPQYKSIMNNIRRGIRTDDDVESKKKV